MFSAAGPLTQTSPRFASVYVGKQRRTAVSLFVHVNCAFCCGKRAVYFSYASPIPFLSLSLTNLCWVLFGFLIFF